MKIHKRLISVLVGLGFFCLLFFGWTQRYDIFDWYRLRGYTPPARIVALADETTMTDYGRRLFYVNHPELNNKLSFNQNCTISEQSIVLGCYVGNQRIFLFDVTDERLNGIHQVTAAHEVLHAAYDRLSSSERNRIDEMTAQEFADLKDERIRETVAAYEARDPSVVPNELHSILATEVENLPPDLESYYRWYFFDRSVIVKYSQQYEAAFNERKKQVEAYDAQLASLRQQIDTLEATLNKQQEDLQAERSRLDQLLAAKRYEEYNAAVPGFNTQVRAYNAAVARVRALIDEFNRIVAARNAIASEENELVEAIDSRPETIQTQ